MKNSTDGSLRLLLLDLWLVGRVVSVSSLFRSYMVVIRVELLECRWIILKGRTKESVLSHHQIRIRSQFTFSVGISEGTSVWYLFIHSGWWYIFRSLIQRKNVYFRGKQGRALVTWDQISFHNWCLFLGWGPQEIIHLPFFQRLINLLYDGYEIGSFFRWLTESLPVEFSIYLNFIKMLGAEDDFGIWMSELLFSSDLKGHTFITRLTLGLFPGPQSRFNLS